MMVFMTFNRVLIVCHILSTDVETKIELNHILSKKRNVLSDTNIYKLSHIDFIHGNMIIKVSFHIR